MKKIYFQNIVEDYPFARMEPGILQSVNFQWNALVYNKGQILENQKVNTSDLPNYLAISDYKHKDNKIITIRLKDKRNINIQIENLDTEYRNTKESVVENSFDKEGKLVSIEQFINGQPNGSVKFEYDKNKNLLCEYRYSKDNSIVTDKKEYIYDKNSNLIRMSEYSDNSSGAGANFLVEEKKFSYNSDFELISSNDTTKYSLTKLNNGHFEFQTEYINQLSKQLNTKVYNERADLISSVYGSELKFSYKRIYNNDGDQTELQCFKNNNLEYISKSEVRRNPPANIR